MTTVESCAMELMTTSKHPQFKVVAGLLKTHNKDFPREFKDFSKFWTEEDMQGLVAVTTNIEI